jgi:hypothetical protein
LLNRLGQGRYGSFNDVGIVQVDELVVPIEPRQAEGTLFHPVLYRIVSFALKLLVQRVSRDGPENAEGKTGRDFVEFRQVAHKPNSGALFSRYEGGSLSRTIEESTG